MRANSFIEKQMPGVALAVCLLLAGCDQGREAAEPAPPAPVARTESLPPAANVPPEEVDLIGDKGDAAAAAKPQNQPLLNDIVPSGPMNAVARRCYALLAEMKTNIENISRDLDGGGKEIERLIHTSDLLSKNVTELAGLWPHDQFFRDACGNAKRQVLVLNEELTRVPRKWAYVRWAFRASLQDISKLRLRARDVAESEPKPAPMLGRDGKPVVDKEGNIVYVEATAPEADPATARREAAIRKVEDARSQRRKFEDEKKKKQMPTELD